ncbi:MAG: right-handed parallel beta-helix repeat-containing protein [Candidatus Tenebribacter mawsonii]|nr:right-handed parallel beta-helix repeat-containing protein [Candidatus Tenebribacter mawsonii]
MISLKKSSTKRSSIEVSGSITSNQFWDADTVKVTDNVIIENGVTVNIASGVKIEFQDFYSIGVKGAVTAIGEPDNLIHFTSIYPEAFMIDHSEYGAWNGIKFDNVSAFNDVSKLVYCIFEYSKSFDEKGGAIRVNNVSDLEITNCIFRNNVADFGGAISFEYHSAPKIFGNLFENNYAYISGSPIYCSYSYPRITNNTIVSNFVLNEEEFHETAAIHTYISKPQITNNIIWNNETNFYDPHQLMNCKAFYTTYNDIEFGQEGNGNVDEQPFFIGSGPHPYSLQVDSPCIDSGTSNILFGFEIPDYDLAGTSRVYNDSIDMGVYEWNGVGVENYELPITNYELSNYPNPFNPTTMISFNLTLESTENTELIIYNLKGQKIKKLEIRNLKLGINNVEWDGTDQSNKPVTSGIYFYKLIVGDFQQVNKMMLLK